MRAIYNIVIILTVILVASFAVANADEVDLFYYFGRVSIPLSLALGIFLAAGCLLGAAVCLKSIVSAKYQIRVLKQEIKLANKEISNLRAIPIKDQH